MDLIKNLQFFEDSCNNFISPKRCHYSPSQLFYQLRRYPHLRLTFLSLEANINQNSYTQTNEIKLTLITQRKNPSKNCLIYLHGLGSYSYEAKFILPFLQDDFTLCMYDLRGHGHNRANIVTFGLLQSIELNLIAHKLIQEGYMRIAFWGRSMGAVACLKMVKDCSQKLLMDSIVYIVADSPFSHFSHIGAEILTKQTGIPQFFTSLLARAFEEKIQQQKSLNLAEVDITSINGVKIPVTFVYSSIDELVSPEHTHLIYENYRGPKEKIDVHLPHNDPRKAETVEDIVNKIKRAFKTAQTNSNLSLSRWGRKTGVSLAKTFNGNLLRESRCLDLRGTLNLNEQDLRQSQFIGDKIEKTQAYGIYRGTNSPMYSPRKVENSSEAKMLRSNRCIERDNLFRFKGVLRLERKENEKGGIDGSRVIDDGDNNKRPLTESRQRFIQMITPIRTRLR